MGISNLVFLAVLPGILIIWYVYKKDKVEQEPWRLIIKLMIFGALSCIPAAFLELFLDGSVLPQYPEGSLGYAMTMAFASAALCEETCKFLFLRFGTWRNPEFGYRFDGIVYGVAVAVGFAVLENIMYVLGAGEGGLATALMRGVLAVPLHSFCGVFMGIFYGAAKKASVDGKSSAGLLILALFVPMMIHGIYDTLAFLGTDTATVLLFAFVLLMYIVSVRYIRQFSKDDWKNGFYPDGQPLSMGGSAGRGPAGGYGGSTGGYGSYGGSTGGYTSSGRRSPYGQYGAYGTQTQYGRPHPGQVHNGKIVLICPHCRGGLQVPAGMGTVRVSCPHCGNKFMETT